MRVLFILRHEGYIRNCEHLLTALAARGHSIRIALSGSSGRSYDGAMMREFFSRHRAIGHRFLPKVPVGFWDDFAGVLRILLDFMRYLDPVYRDAPKLRNRVERQTPLVFRFLFDRIPWMRRPSVLRGLDRRLRAAEHAIPVKREIQDVLEEEKPDAVLFCPLLDYESSSLDYLKGAKRSGLRTGLIVASWDNLTNKGLVQMEPDRVIVWNEVQRSEAVRMHGLAPEKIRVTGAHLFDHWFKMQPSQSGEDFRSRAGLDPSTPFLLYTGSSGFVSEDGEVDFVKRWIARIRGSGNAELRRMGILVRPHPGNRRSWEGVDLSSFGNAAVWLPDGAAPHHDQGKTDYYDTLFHSLAVVGINTSAMIEAGVVGRPVYTILAPEFGDTQRGTLHFHYLVEGGLVKTSGGLEEHLAQLAELAEDPRRGGTNGRAERFVRDFVRPHGLATPCAPLAAAAVEELAAVEPRPEPAPGSLWRAALAPLALITWGFGSLLRAGNVRKRYTTLTLLLKNQAKKREGRSKAK